jgi:uncharacterized phage-like protein YoqJ
MNESIAFSGHRPDKLDNDYEMRSPLVRKIEGELCNLIQIEQPREILIGMAIGIDTLVGRLSLALGFPYIACLPFKGQERKWSQYDQDLFHALLKNAREIVICDFKNRIVTYEEYLEMEGSPPMLWKYTRRNIYMVDRSDKLVGVSDGMPGSGTEGTIKYAVGQVKPVIRIDINKYRP